VIVVLLGALCAAPTAGDIGGCGRSVNELDPARFAVARKLEDCQRCTQCGIATERCTRACDPKQTSDVLIPQTCKPLYHDGEVCLRALDAASCDDYTKYEDDFAPTNPSECEFCRVVPPPPSSGGVFGDAAPPEGGAP
jgi:hypothetical protein